MNAVPDLVRRAAVAVLGTFAVISVLASFIRSPLEEAANALVTPNPAKAPWYFLGLQEMVSYSAFWGGIGIPGLLVALAVAAPYLERTPGGEGTWFHHSRSGANWTFLTVMAVLGILTLIGTLFRGVNWTLVVPW